MFRQSARLLWKRPRPAKWGSRNTTTPEVYTGFTFNLTAYQAMRLRRLALAGVVFPTVFSTAVYCASTFAQYLEYFNTWTPEDGDGDEEEDSD